MPESITYYKAISNSVRDKIFKSVFLRNFRVVGIYKTTKIISKI